MGGMFESLDGLFVKRRARTRVPRVRISAERKARIVSGSYEMTDDEKDFYGSFGDPANRDMVDPPASKLLPETGAWVLIVRPLPAIEGDIDEHVKVGRIFYAQRFSGADAKGFAKNGTYKVLLPTPWGEVGVYPHEYTVVGADLVLQMWQAGELVFHPTDVEPVRLNEIVFYCQSRCISLADAMVMALGTFNAPVGWFEPSEELAEAVEDMSRVGRLTEVNYTRRRAAHEAKKGDA